MKKTFKSLGFLLVFVILIASIAGCGTNQSKTTSEATASQTTIVSTSQSTSAQPEIEKFKKYNPQITLSTFLASDQTSDTVKYVEGEDSEHNPVYKLFEDFMGIKVTNKIFCPPNALKDKLQLAIATNDIPDFGVVDAVTISKMIKADMVEDQTDVYNTYASDNMKALLEIQNKVLFSSVTRDGRIMALPAPASTMYGPVLWVRKDWREKLNIQIPKTMEDVFAMAKAFTTQDPDGNGKKDTLGLYLNKDLFGLNWIINAYGAYPAPINADYMMWFKDSSGNYYNGVTDSKAKVPLAKMNELYKIGAIDKEFAIKDTSKEDELVASGKLGICLGYFWSPLSPLQNSLKNNPNSDWEGLALPPAEGLSEYKSGCPLPVLGYAYLKKGVKPTEALVVMMNWLADGQAAPWRHEGGLTDFAKKFEGIASDPKYKSKSYNNWLPMQFQATENWGKIFKEAYDAGQKTVIGMQSDYDRVCDPDPVVAWPWMKTYFEGYPASLANGQIYSGYSGGPTESWVQTKSLLDKEQLTSYIAYIMGSKPIDDFGNFVQRYNDLGAAKIAQEIKDAN